MGKHPIKNKSYVAVVTVEWNRTFQLHLQSKSEPTIFVKFCNFEARFPLILSVPLLLISRLIEHESSKIPSHWFWDQNFIEINFDSISELLS